jgi:hypothetical protein
LTISEVPTRSIKRLAGLGRKVSLRRITVIFNNTEKQFMTKQTRLNVLLMILLAVFLSTTFASAQTAKPMSIADLAA